MLAQRPLFQLSRAVRATSTRSLHSTPRLLQTAAREEQAAHTATQRVRFWIKSLPIETYPLCKFCFLPISEVWLLIGHSRCYGILAQFWNIFVCEAGVAGSYVEVEEKYREGCRGWSLRTGP